MLMVLYSQKEKIWYCNFLLSFKFEKLADFRKDTFLLQLYVYIISNIKIFLKDHNKCRKFITYKY